MIVEIPKNSGNKYEYDSELGVFRLSNRATQLLRVRGTNKSQAAISASKMPPATKKYCEFLNARMSSGGGIIGPNGMTSSFTATPSQ